VATPNTSLKWEVKESKELINALCESHIALAHISALSERSEVRNATLARSVVNFWGCISIYREI
jgi:hypothetical protein